MTALTAAPPHAPQHVKALAKANRVRLARAELKAQIASGEKTVPQVLWDVPWMAESMTIGALLMAQHRWGRTRTLRLLASIPVGENKQVADMTGRQRRLVASMLDWHAS